MDDQIERERTEFEEDETLASETKLLNATLEGIEDAVIVVSHRTRKILRCNRAITGVFGYSPDEVVGRTTEMLHVDREHFLRFAEISEPKLDQGQSFRTEYTMKHGSGGIFIAEITVTPIETSPGNREGVVSVVRDTSSKLAMKDSLAESIMTLEERLKELRFLYTVTELCNDSSLSSERFLGDVARLLPSALQFPAASGAQIQALDRVFYSERFNRNWITYEQSLVSNSGDKIGELIVSLDPDALPEGRVPFLNEEKEMLETLAIQCAGRIESDQAEIELGTRRRQIEAVFEGSNDAFFIIDDDGRITEINSAACSLLGYDQNFLVGSDFRQFITVERSSGSESEAVISRWWLRLLSDGSLRVEIVLVGRGGRRIDAEISAVANFVPHRHLGIVRDMTDHKRTETELRNALAERSFLTREIHHRVKNNLQVILSLLSLQIGQQKNNDCLGHMIDTQNRIRSIALVHEQVLEDERFDAVDISHYLPSLVSWLNNSYGEIHVEIEVRCSKLRLGAEQVLPCGLAVTELISNAVKHAFPGRAQGHVTVELTTGSGQEIRLSVTDDGVGLPPGFSMLSSATLGATLVRSAAQQLGGEITETVSNHGTSIQILFSVPR